LASYGTCADFLPVVGIRRSAAIPWLRDRDLKFEICDLKFDIGDL
jgi:hypothetical protein